MSFFVVLLQSTVIMGVQAKRIASSMQSRVNVQTNQAAWPCTIHRHDAQQHQSLFGLFGSVHQQFALKFELT